MFLCGAWAQPLLNRACVVWHPIPMGSCGPSWLRMFLCGTWAQPLLNRACVVWHPIPMGCCGHLRLRALCGIPFQWALWALETADGCEGALWHRGLYTATVGTEFTLPVHSGKLYENALVLTLIRSMPVEAVSSRHTLCLLRVISMQHQWLHCAVSMPGSHCSMEGCHEGIGSVLSRGPPGDKSMRPSSRPCRVLALVRGMLSVSSSSFLLAFLLFVRCPCHAGPADCFQPVISTSLLTLHNSCMHCGSPTSLSGLSPAATFIAECLCAGYRDTHEDDMLDNLSAVVAGLFQVGGGGPVAGGAVHVYEHMKGHAGWPVGFHARIPRNKSNRSLHVHMQGRSK
eukprot:1150819-Pelagomonas_calceolata.AAC.1